MAPLHFQAKAHATNAVPRPKKRDLTTSNSIDRIPESKEDKRRMKHSILISKARASARVAKPHSRRRRPLRKLKATQDMEDLLASLPTVSAATKEPTSNTRRNPDSSRAGSLASRPGVQKRRTKTASQEQERFSKNLAMMRAHGSGNTSSGSTHWSTLKDHIAKNLEG